MAEDPELCKLLQNALQDPSSHHSVQLDSLKKNVTFPLPPLTHLQHMTLLLEQSTTSKSFDSCSSPTSRKHESVPTWYLIASPGRGAKSACYQPEGWSSSHMMGQECLLAISLGSYAACHEFIDSPDTSLLLFAILPTCCGIHCRI